MASLLPLSESLSSAPLRAKLRGSLAVTRTLRLSLQSLPGLPSLPVPAVSAAAFESAEGDGGGRLGGCRLGSAAPPPSTRHSSRRRHNPPPDTPPAPPVPSPCAASTATATLLPSHCPALRSPSLPVTSTAVVSLPPSVVVDGSPVRSASAGGAERGGGAAAGGCEEAQRAPVAALSAADAAERERDGGEGAQRRRRRGGRGRGGGGVETRRPRSRQGGPARGQGQRAEPPRVLQDGDVAHHSRTQQPTISPLCTAPLTAAHSLLLSSLPRSARLDAAQKEAEEARKVSQEKVRHRRRPHLAAAPAPTPLRLLSPASHGLPSLVCGAQIMRMQETARRAQQDAVQRQMGKA